MKKLGVIGLGNMGMVHLMNCVKANDATVSAVADSSKRALKKASSLGIKNVYTDYNELVNKHSDDLDAVIISLPNFLHFESIKLALESGLDVFVEKPLANTTKECNEIAKLVQKYGRKLMVGHVERFFGCIEEMKENLEKGYLGKLEVITLESISSGPFSCGDTPKPVPEWWFDNEKVGGGVLIDIGYHLIDLFRFFAGDCHLLSCHLGHKFNLPVDDSAITVVESDDSLVKGIVHVGWYEQITFPKSDYRVILHGDSGFISSKEFEPTNVYRHAMSEGVKNLFRKVSGKKIRPLTYAVYHDAFAKEMNHFLDCLENDLEPSVTAIDGLKTIEIIEEAYSCQK